MTIGPSKFEGKRVFVDRWANATVRYLYEYGPIRRYMSGIYPNSFVFEETDNSKQKWKTFDYLFSSGYSDEEINQKLGDEKRHFFKVGKSSESKIFQRL